MALRTNRKTVEEKHWWYVGRRLIIEKLLSCLPPGPVLDIGCGYTGTTMNGSGLYIPIDIDIGKLESARNANNAKPILASAEQLPFHDNTFTNVFLLDVLEHLRDDWLALREANRILKPGGFALTTVPAFPALWSVHDKSEMHIRRYRKSDLLGLCGETGFQIVKCGYFNSILFPLAVAWRLLSKRLYRFKEARDDFIMLPASINTFLGKFFGLERHVVPSIYLPFGLSLFAILKKT